MFTWLRRLFGPSVRRATRPPFLPEVVTLEERCTPSLGATFSINNNNASSFDVKVATSDNGNSVVVFTLNIPGNLRDIAARLVDHNGTMLGSEIATGTEDQYDPDVAIDAAGNFVVVWESNIQNTPDRNVFAKVYSNTGTLKHLTSVADGGLDATNPVVAMSATGTWICAFETAAMEGRDIYAKRFNFDGVQAGKTIGVSRAFLLDDSNPEIDANDSGAFTISFQRETDVVSVYELHARRYTATGKLLGTTLVATSSPTVVPPRHPTTKPFPA
ncbi:MAG: hypothetical protein EXR98_05485 [Gemmataceae bacterium]|nr:hypothetical protein [Gemmataceae bacterium]